MSTTFFDTTAAGNNTSSTVGLCPLQRLGSSFSIPAGNWKITSVKIGFDGSLTAPGTHWNITSLDIYTDVAGAPGVLVGTMLANYSLVTPVQAVFLFDFTALITPVTVAGGGAGARFWLLIKNTVGGFDTQVEFVFWPPPIYPAEFTADCAPAQNSLNNTPMMAFVAGDPLASGTKLVLPFPRKLPWVLDKPRITEGRHIFMK